MFNNCEMDLDSIDTKELENLMIIFRKQDDTRMQGKVKHLMSDIIMITFLAILARCDGWDEIGMFAISKKEWLSSFLELPNGIPSHDTIQRVISILDPQSLYTDTINYLINKINLITVSNERDILSMDGKTTNGSKRASGENKEEPVVNTMSVYSNNYGISLIQDYITKKSNEIPMGPKLLKKLQLEGCIVTADALNTQVDTIKAILKGKADYVLPVKENQLLTFTEIKEYFNDEKLYNEVKKENYLKVTSKEHNAIITREYCMTNDIKLMNKKEKWPGLKSIGLSKNTIEKEGNISIEIRYYIVSFSNDIDLFSKSVRNEWGIENNLHAPLDIVFREDKNKTLEKKWCKKLRYIKKNSFSNIKICTNLL